MGTEFHYKNLVDIRKVDLSAELDAFASEISVDPYRVLVVYGAPCQGYCMVNAERGEAMSPEHIVNLHCKICLDTVKKRFPHALFCVENTASMSKEMKAMMANLLGVAAIQLDSADFGAA